MEPFITFAETASIAVIGILLRFLVAVALLAIVVAPLAVFFLGLERLARIRDRARGLMRDGTLLWRQGLFYAPSHTWLGAQADGSVRIGLDDIAQKALPGARVLQMAPVGTALKTGDALATLDVGGHRLTVAAPTDGTVVSTNPRVAREPRLLHLDPYRRGWIATLLPRTRDFEQWPSGEQARTWLRQEDHRLNAFLEMELGIAAADGGEWIVPPTAMMSEAQFEAMRREFLTPR
jgi:glycine cleavage system H protein